MGNRNSSRSSSRSESISDPDETYFFSAEIELRAKKWEHRSPFSAAFREKKIAPVPETYLGFWPNYTSSMESLEETPELDKKRKSALRALKKAGPGWVSCAETAAQWKEASKGKRRRPRQKEDQPEERPVTPEHYWNPGWVSPKKNNKS